ncbi:MAG: hypothetical protein ACWGNB_01665, partial [Thiogranum sp.]
LFTMAYSGRDYYLGAWKQLRHRQSNMDTLVAVGTAAAWLASVLLILFPDFVPPGQRHLYLETSVLILAFLQFGHALEVRARAAEPSEHWWNWRQKPPAYCAVAKNWSCPYPCCNPTT